MSPDSSLVTFLCTHCYTKFQAPADLRGARVLCRSCKAVTFVTLEADPASEKARKELFNKLQGAIPQWVRVKCSCGKSIKGPATLAGKIGSCPRCSKPVRLPGTAETVSPAEDASADIEQDNQPSLMPGAELQPSEDSTVVAPDAAPQAAEGFDFREIKHTRLKEKKEDSTRFDGFVRAKCACGFRVKAPAEQGGKTGACPRCGQIIIMPLPPVFKLVSALDAMVTSDDIEQIDEEDENNKTSMIAFGSSLADSLDTSLETKPVEEAAPVEAGSQLQSLAGDTPFQRAVFFTKLFFRKRYEKFHARVVQNPAVTIAVSTLCFAGAVSLAVWEYKIFWKPRPIEIVWKSHPVPVTFYDVESGQLFAGYGNQVSPVPGLSSGEANTDPEKMGYRVYRYSCTSCATDAQRIPGLIETFTPAAREAWNNRMVGSRIPDIPALYDATERELVGRLIAKPEKPIAWVEAHTFQGVDFRKAVEKELCPEGKVAELCRE